MLLIWYIWTPHHLAHVLPNMLSVSLHVRGVPPWCHDKCIGPIFSDQIFPAHRFTSWVGCNNVSHYFIHLAGVNVAIRLFSSCILLKTATPGNDRRIGINTGALFSSGILLWSIVGVCSGVWRHAACREVLYVFTWRRSHHHLFQQKCVAAHHWMMGTLRHSAIT